MSNRLPTKGKPERIFRMWCETAGTAYWLDYERPRLWRIRYWLAIAWMDILNPLWHWGW